VTASVLATEQGVAMALRRARPTGRHRKTSHSTPVWTISQRHKPVTARTTARHRKPTQAPTPPTPPRHRKKGRGSGQVLYPKFSTAQGDSIRMATRRVAIPSVFAVGMLAVGGAITGGFSMPSHDADRASASGPGGVPSVFAPSPPALSAMATPIPDVVVMPQADRSSRGPIVGSGPAWPIHDQAATLGVGGDGAVREPSRTGTTTTTVRDRAPEFGAFAPLTTADPPPSGHGGGGPAESSAPTSTTPAPPPAGGGLFNAFRTVGQADEATAKPVEANVKGASGGDGAVDPNSNGPNTVHDDDAPAGADHGTNGDAGNAAAGDGGPDGGQRDRRGEARGADSSGGTGDGSSGGSSESRKANDSGGAGNSGRGGQSGGGGHDRRGGGDGQ
jgi:hypothetical protein